MPEDKHLQDLYRGANADKNKTPIEQQIERYYTLLHLKLSPRKLQAASRANIILLVGLLVVFLIGILILPKPTVSSIEKRELAKKPTFSVTNLFNGTLTRDYEAYFADTFPVREWMISLSAVIDESRGVRFNDVRIVAPSVEQQPVEQDINTTLPAVENADIPPEATTADGGNTPAPPDDDKPAENEPTNEPANVSNGIFIYGGKAMSLFGGSPTSARRYADVLNTYQAELPGVQIYNIVVPTAIEFYVPDKYRDMTSSQKNIIDTIYSTLNSGIKQVDAYSALEGHQDEYVYFRTDHHWTGLGAYYVYREFCKQAGLVPVELDDAETRRLDEFIGTMYAQTQDSTLLKEPDYVDYYIFDQKYTATRNDKGTPYSATPHTLWGEYAKSPNSYSVFLHGDFPLISVKTGITNGRKIMVVKESFGNAFAPFLINNYEEVYIVDQRYFELSTINLIKENGINELLFINNAFAACTPYHIQCIDNLRHQVYTPPIVKPEEEIADEPEDDPEATAAMADADDQAKKRNNSTAKNNKTQSSESDGERLNISKKSEE